MTSSNTIAHYHKQDIDVETVKMQIISITTSILCCFFRATFNSLLLHLNLRQSLNSSIFYCVILRMLHKWSHTVCYLLGLAFVTQHHSLEIVAGINSLFFFLMLIDIPKYSCVTFVNHSLIEGHLGFYQLGLVQMKLL
jgi:hypothetical protein